MTIDPLTIRNRHELADFLRDRDQEELTTTLTQLGTRKVLQAVFDGMARGYLPEQGPRERAVVQWEIRDPEHGYQTWQTIASREGLVVLPEAGEVPDVTLRVELVPFLQIMAGTMRGIEALSAGTLRLKGNLQLAMEMEGWFED
jgi:SCP-2 sterol transfer family protein